MSEAGDLDAEHGGEARRAALADAAPDDVEDRRAGHEQQGEGGDHKQVQLGGFKHGLSDGGAAVQLPPDQ